MRFGSVCSGIEAASVAWHPLGWQAAWLSEIEPFPSAVLAHHYPDVPNLGDMTTLPERILSGEVEAPDLFCGGTPCQAFSVAGLRNSLDDARGNLSLTFVGIANAIDHVRSVRSDAPGIIFWENVPGVLSTKDNAFGCFLGALAGEDDPLVPSGEKWTNVGCVYGPQRAVAWRVLDAQYFGVAQRRRRVFVVASARDDFDPAAVLFEFDGVRRDTAPSREAGKTVAPTVTNGPPFRRTGNERVEAEAMVLMDQGGSVMNIEYDMVGTLRRETHGHEPVIVHGTQDPCVSDIAFAQGRNNGGENVLVQPISIHPHCIGRAPETGPQGKEYLLDGSAYCMDSRGQPQAVALPVGFILPFAHTLTSSLSSTCCPNEDATLIALPISINSMNALRSADADPTTGCGIGEAGEAMFTLTKGQHHAVAQPIALQDVRPVEKAQNGKGWNDDGTAYTVDTHATQGVAQAIAFAQNQRDEVRVMDVAGALAAQPGMKQQTYLTQPYIGGVDYENNAHTMDQPTGPLLKGSPTGGGRPLPAIATAMQVRRLTPVECERLQGFPDNYTNIPWRKKPESPDGPRYKALGNSWAVPNVRWIGKRIQEALNAPT